MAMAVCGSLSSIPAIWINSVPRMRRSFSVSGSRPSSTDGVRATFSDAIKTFSNVKIILEKFFSSLATAADAGGFTSSAAIIDISTPPPSLLCCCHVGIRRRQRRRANDRDESKLSPASAVPVVELSVEVVSSSGNCTTNVLKQNA